MKYNFEDLQHRISHHLNNNRTPATKAFWRGYLLALLQYHITPDKEYDQLLKVIKGKQA